MTALAGASPLLLFGSTYPMQALFFALSGALCALLLQGVLDAWRRSHRHEHRRDAAH